MKKCRKFSMVHGKICRKFSVEKFGVEKFPWEMQKSSVENFLSKNVMFASYTCTQPNTCQTCAKLVDFERIFGYDSKFSVLVLVSKAF